MLTVVLLTGVALNFGGAIRLSLPRTGEPAAAGEVALFRAFTAGTAAVFGAMYLYLAFEPGQVIPFLAFGAALKTWAFVVAARLHRAGRLDRDTLIEFGVSNGLVAILFWIAIATVA